MSNVKDKERILKAEREKQRVTYKGVPIRLSADFSRETAGKKGLGRTIHSDKMQGPTNQDYSIQQSSHLEWKDR